MKLDKYKIWEIIDYSFEHYWKKTMSKKIVSLKNWKRVLIDLPKWVF